MTEVKLLKVGEVRDPTYPETVMRPSIKPSFFILFLLIPAILHAAEPEVRVLVPGFTVRPLPIKLTNVNNLAFAPDGRLYALGYDGRVHRLVDTDGDGLEDKAEPYWDRPTIQVPVGLAWSPEGLYVSSNGKVSLLRDDDGDGKADREEVVTSGWPPTDVPSGGVDALGVTLDKDGNLYFGLGTPDYSNAYRLKDGKPRYDIKGERGTVIKLSPDRKRREVVATGIRFPYALRFNRHGDLFATDQEGETWLPGGNPLDELNQIIPGRHYGFPPRHEAYLPGVNDEPPVVAFGPQHQSTCGLVFNEKKEGWKSFGPESWEGDALVTGFSRGKVWRVRLVKTPQGYVGRPTPLAASSMMVADVAVSPSGEMSLSCHGGPPDWGSGPQGEGKLFRVTYDGPELPQPVIAWAAGPMEVHVAFDRPLDPVAAQAATGRTITFGEHVRAADRFEMHKPPYEAVKRQQATPKGLLRVTSARLLDDGRTLALATDPHPWGVTYALEVPDVRGVGLKGPGATIDLDYTLAGVVATWQPDRGGELGWEGWWPHLDPAVARALTAGSSGHDRGFALLCRAGRLSLQTLVRLPKGRVTLSIVADGLIEARLGGQISRTSSTSEGRQRLDLGVDSTGVPVALDLGFSTGVGGKAPEWVVSYHTEADPTERPLPLDRLRLPWSPSAIPSLAEPTVLRPDLAGGDPGRGEVVFASEQARCSSCHKFRGKGGDIGPDLSNLMHRDAASVYRDIAEPNATIHPDYVPFSVAVKDGRVLTGLVRSEGTGSIRVTGTDARSVVIGRDEVEELRPVANSVMPTGLVTAIGEAKVRDLLAFLLTPPTDAKAEGPPNAGPPLRSRSEVEGVLGKTAEVAAKPRPLKVVLVAGPQDHGPGEHDYPAWQRRWKEILGNAPGLEVTTAEGWPGEGQWRDADLVVLNLWNHDWSPGRLGELDAFLARGGGVVALHAALIADKEPEALALRFGLSAQPVRTKYRHGPLDLEIAAPVGHPITKGQGSARYVDETYWPMVGDPTKVEVLATAVEEGKAHPMIWTFESGQGRVFGSVLGHYSWTLDDPLFRLLVLRGMAWAAREPVSRFDAQATIDVKFRDSH